MQISIIFNHEYYLWYFRVLALRLKVRQYAAHNSNWKSLHVYNIVRQNIMYIILLDKIKSNLRSLAFLCLFVFTYSVLFNHCYTRKERDNIILEEDLSFSRWHVSNTSVHVERVEYELIDQW